MFKSTKLSPKRTNNIWVSFTSKYFQWDRNPGLNPLQKELIPSINWTRKENYSKNRNKKTTSNQEAYQIKRLKFDPQKTWLVCAVHILEIKNHNIRRKCSECTIKSIHIDYNMHGVPETAYHICGSCKFPVRGKVAKNQYQPSAHKTKNLENCHQQHNRAIPP